MNPPDSSPVRIADSWWRGIIIALDHNGAITHLNEKGSAILACSFEKVEGKLWIDTFIQENERDQTRSIFNNLISGNLAPYSTVEGRVITCRGIVRFIRWYNTLLKDADGKITGTMSYGEDITEEKQVQDSLRKMQQFQESVIANANIWIAVLSSDSTILVWNEAAEAISGYKKSDVIGKKTVWKHLYPDKDYRRKVTGEIQRIIGRDRYLENFETEIRCADGTKKTIVWNTRGLRDNKSTITGFIAIGRDITERKRAEEAQQKSEEKFRIVADYTYDWEYWIAPDGTFIYVTPSCERITGYSAGDFYKNPSLFSEIIYPQDKAAYDGHMELVSDSKDTESVEYRIVRKDGGIRGISHTCLPMFGRNGELLGRRSSNRDETERKRAEEALQKSEEKFRGLFEHSRDGIVIADAKTMQFFDNNHIFSQMIGYSPEEIKNLSVPDIHPEDALSHALEEFKKIARREIDVAENLQVKRKDGTIFYADISSYPINISGKDSLVGVFRDVTERKQVEEAMKESKILIDAVVENVPLMIFLKEAKDLRFVIFNRAGEELLGYDRQVLLGKNNLDLFPPEQATNFMTKDREVLDGDAGMLDIPEEPITTAKKGLRLLHTRKVCIRGADGTTKFLLGISEDITERKQMETTLRESRQLFADIISFLPDATFVIDNDGKVLAWNRALEQHSGIPAEAMIGKGDHEYSIWQYGKRRPILIDLVLHPEQVAARLNYSDIRVDGHTVTAQTEIIPTGSGHKTSLLLIASPLVDAQGNITGAIESIRDISHLKETEAELARINQNLEKIVSDRTRILEDEIARRIHAEKDVKDSLNYTRSVIEANPDLITVLDREGTVMDVNAATESLTGVTREQMIGTPYFSFIVDDGTLKDVFSRLLEKGRIENNIQVRRSDGHTTPVSINATLIPGTGATDTRIIVAGHDITRQKQDEESIKASLDEKILLLREVHHRVKNNLQIIISLVSLQMRQTNDPAVKQILSDTQNRVRAMSLVHEKLYRSGSLSHIDFADYTRFLASQLLSFYGTDTRKVRLDFAIEKIPLDINTAVPLGLLMNELISNSLRHAFPGGREGVISISGGYNGDLITLVVRDNGIGIPEELDWKSTKSLGMQLVTSLVDQVDGTITLDRENGTMFTITVKRASHHEEPDDGHIQANRGLPESPAGKSP